LFGSEGPLNGFLLFNPPKDVVKLSEKELITKELHLFRQHNAGAVDTVVTDDGFHNIQPKNGHKIKNGYFSLLTSNLATYKRALNSGVAFSSGVAFNSRVAFNSAAVYL